MVTIITLYGERENYQMRKTSFFTALWVSLLTLAFTTAAFAAPWKFGIMSDTQWKGSPDGLNPNYVAVNVINHLNQEFIKQGVKFVVQVGDLSQNGDILGLDTTATFRQALYNAGIGFYPLRGNHESSATAAAEVQRIFPQTQTGINNQTPADALVNNTVFGPQTNTNTTFPVGTNFNSSSADFAGLTYSFDYDNARIVLLDQFTPPSGASHSTLTDSEVAWVGSRLSGRPAGTHAFVFSHKGLITENHADNLFGNDPSANPDLTNTFMADLSQNGVRYLFGGHDHMHNRGLITSPDGNYKVQDITTASNSYKFYIPQTTPNDVKYDNPTREMEIAQELFTIGYYIVTVDGPRVTVDYYSSPNGCNGDCDQDKDVIPYTFTKRESFGYSLNGREFQVAQVESFSTVQDSFHGTTARILSGVNGSTAADYAGRPFSKLVDTGWTPKTIAKHKKDDETASDILTLWGMADLGSDHTDVYTLSMSYEPSKLLPIQLGQGLLGLAAKDRKGNWVNAVDMNIGGKKKFVLGPWKPGFELGTYGIDLKTRTAWAVINYNADFAVAGFRHLDKTACGRK
jgi:hypothetical protein